MKVLIACEFSGIVREAFAKRGHFALSCDLLDTEIPGHHVVGDVRYLLNEGWDLMIAHPPCTYLCVPGAHYLHTQRDRWSKLSLAREFFMLFVAHPCPKKCIENPVPHKYARLPKYSQIIHPWMFGHEISKRTALWLYGLPRLVPTDIRENHGERYERTVRQQQAGRGKTSNSVWYAAATAKERSRTFQGIANAMAEQWG